MLQTNHNNSPCAFAEQLTSYLYGEIEAKEARVFETHLQKCADCADEFAAFGVVRSSVVEWRETDFADLKTPHFEFPMSAETNSFSANAIDSESWFSKLRQQFSFNPILSAAVLAILIVCVGVIFVALNFTNKNEFADNLNNKNSTYEAAVSPTIEKKVEETKINMGDNDKEKSASVNSPKVVETLVIKDNFVDLKQTVSKNPAAEVSTKTLNNIAASTSTNSDKNENKKPSNSRSKRTHTLTYTDDDEDDSIRLADLFAEIDTK